MQVDTRLLCHGESKDSWTLLRAKDSPKGERRWDLGQSNQHGARVVPATLEAQMERWVEARCSKPAQMQHWDLVLTKRREREREGESGGGKEGSRCVRGSFNVGFQVLLNHLSLLRRQVVQSWCCLREQEGVGMEVASSGLNKHYTVWCGIQLSEWVPKDWVQLPRRMREPAAAKPWLMEMWTKQTLSNLPWGTFPLMFMISPQGSIIHGLCGIFHLRKNPVFIVSFSFSFLLADLGLCFQIKHWYSTHVPWSAFQGTQRERKFSIR